MKIFTMILLFTLFGDFSAFVTESCDDSIVVETSSSCHSHFNKLQASGNSSDHSSSEESHHSDCGYCHFGHTHSALVFESRTLVRNSLSYLSKIYIDTSIGQSQFFNHFIFRPPIA